jgi:sulfane dehydrogenase subunit SoxC
MDQEAKSVITSPSGGQVILDRGSTKSRVCVVGRGRVRRVDVSTDGGRNWRTRGGGTGAHEDLTRFRIDWTWNGERALLQSRVTDDTGYVRPSYRGARSTRDARFTTTTRSDVARRSERRVSNVQVMS